jgi:2-(1,2-epoxy-1,2-dihydrophenyl)acetyl-CoA isomerase
MLRVCSKLPVVGVLTMPMSRQDHPLVGTSRVANETGVTMTGQLLETIEGRVVTLTLNRPERLNAFSPELYDRLLSTLDRLAADENIGVVVITGAGRAFCAGGDVKTMESRRDLSFEESAQGLRRRTAISSYLHDMPRATIAAVNGAAMGAGFSVALACDFRIAAETARFSTSFAKIGLSGDFGGTYFLTHLVGPTKAKELYFTGETLNAQQASALGIVSKVVPDAELQREATALAQTLASGPLVAMRYMKANINAVTRGASLSELLDLEAIATARTRLTDDHLEATRAFGEKRPPKFNGR